MRQPVSELACDGSCLRRGEGSHAPCTFSPITTLASCACAARPAQLPLGSMRSAVPAPLDCLLAPQVRPLRGNEISGAFWLPLRYMPPDRDNVSRMPDSQRRFRFPLGSDVRGCVEAHRVASLQTPQLRLLLLAVIPAASFQQPSRAVSPVIIGSQFARGLLGYRSVRRPRGGRSAPTGCSAGRAVASM